MVDINILTPWASPIVAVGNDARGMEKALRTHGYRVRLHAGDSNICNFENVFPLAAYRERSLSSANAILIYHHAVGWPSGENLLKHSNDVLVVRYHNVTPSAFFNEHSRMHVLGCALGEEFTRRCVQRGDCWFWAASAYSRDELIECGAEPDRCSIIPPFHCIDDIASAPVDQTLAQMFGGFGTRMLSVGAFRPHKGQARLIRIFAQYCKGYDLNSHLVMAGSSEIGLAGYVQDLRDLARELGVFDRITIAENLTSSQLHALYTTANLFLCASEHEGFGVPIAEAMYFGLPIVALARAAVAETVGEVGILLPNSDESSFVEAIREIVANPQKSAELTRMARERYERMFTNDAVRRRLIASIDSVLTTLQ